MTLKHISYHISKIKELEYMPHWCGCEGSRNSHAVLVAMQNWVTDIEFSYCYQKTHAVTFDPCTSLPVIYSKGILAKIWKNTHNFSLKHCLFCNKMQSKGGKPKYLGNMVYSGQRNKPDFSEYALCFIYTYMNSLMFTSSFHWKCLKQWLTTGAMSVSIVFSKYPLPPKNRVFKRDSWSQVWERKCINGSQ